MQAGDAAGTGDDGLTSHPDGVLSDEYVAKLLDSQRFLPVRILQDYVGQNADNIEKMQELAIQYARAARDEPQENDEALLCLIAHLTLGLAGVRSSFAQGFQKAICGIFKLGCTYQELILVNLSGYYEAADKVAQFSLHLIKIANMTLLGRQAVGLPAESALGQARLERLVRFSQAQRLYHNPRDTYFANIARYLDSPSPRVSAYARQRF